MVRRQVRGERRIGDILDAALTLFAEAGYDRTSTNAIAARAGMSPGSLYQYFSNKEAIAEALSRRLLEELREAHATAFDATSAAELPLADLVSRVVDPLVAFHVANPGAKVLIGDRGQPLHDGVTDRVAVLLRERAPELPDDAVQRTSTVTVQIVAALMGSIVAAAEPEREALAQELKRALTGYLSLVGGI
ncbi:TetR/AcrR family transcriptional regulator [Actinoplanes derwentensis]|uniref:Regulatory protein, tetR family n=1 Tax=Actinoplanes derwentensis TaxID=113562 RepID=A0A1H2CRT2_9ACTN|nr:TetR/AcrR family transcriptional regulator [Actinoplanes derwentensis]GID89853.1 TetR family transcriptional regulator [Actinoplanes derwentensis]SDT72977.1 regulatory protein, tetR family [Actinoplanes derwentensis]